MEQERIEKLETRRQQAILGQTVGFIVWFGLFLVILGVGGWKNAPATLVVLTTIMLVGVAVFFFYTMKLVRITRQITSDPKIRAAVNNELFIKNDRRASVWAYYVTLTAVTVLFVVAQFTEISAVLACGILLFVGAVSAKIAQLIVHRE